PLLGGGGGGGQAGRDERGVFQEVAAADRTHGAVLLAGARWWEGETKNKVSTPRGGGQAASGRIARIAGRPGRRRKKTEAPPCKHAGDLCLGGGCRPGRDRR